MRRWNSLSFVVALVLLMLAAPWLHGQLGDWAYFFDLLLFVCSFVVLRYLFGLLD